jgi:cell division protein FtsZ
MPSNEELISWEDGPRRGGPRTGAAVPRRRAKKQPVKRDAIPDESPVTNESAPTERNEAPAFPATADAPHEAAAVSETPPRPLSVSGEPAASQALPDRAPEPAPRDEERAPQPFAASLPAPPEAAPAAPLSSEPEAASTQNTMASESPVSSEAAPFDEYVTYQPEPARSRTPAAAEATQGEAHMATSSSRITGAAVIRVIGVGGAGSNAVDRMIEVGLHGVEFIAANTDLQALERAMSDGKLQLGPEATNGLGAGGDPEIGTQAAEESRQEIRKVLEGSDMVFITAGMGGGTGTGAAPVVAEVSREAGALTVAVVTKPFAFERGRRQSIAEEGLDNLRTKVDTLITVPNDRLLGVVQKKVSLVEAFRLADEVLREGVQGISDLITIPGLINLDFADVKAIMQDAGTALMGIGVGRGETRAVDAAQAAISSPLLETTIDGATRILFNISGGGDLSLSEVEEAAQVIRAASDSPDTNVLFGVVVNEDQQEEVKITVLATGFDRSRRAHGEAESALPSVQSVASDDLEVPTFLRGRG